MNITPERQNDNKEIEIDQLVYQLYDLTEEELKWWKDNEYSPRGAKC